MKASDPVTQSPQTDPATGTLLIAHPLLQDPNFRRTVVLLCRYEPDEGSFGLVLNRVFEQPMNEVLVDFESFSTAIHLGGPVQTDTLHVLHVHGDIEGALPVVDGVWWGGDGDLIRNRVEIGREPLDSYRFFIGYSGWSDGQLEEEIAEGTWVLHPASAKHLFDTDPDRLWRSVLREKGGEYAVLANFPDDPRMN